MPRFSRGRQAAAHPPAFSYITAAGLWVTGQHPVKEVIYFFLKKICPFSESLQNTDESCHSAPLSTRRGRTLLEGSQPSQPLQGGGCTPFPGEHRFILKEDG